MPQNADRPRSGPEAARRPKEVCSFSNAHGSTADKLAQREQRAREGIIQFAEEMQAIRREKLYPNAGKTNAWKTYCQERWGMSETTVRQTIQAIPVLRSREARGLAGVGVQAARAVATLPEPVQDAILGKTTNRDEVKSRAKAVRVVQRKAKREGRKATEEEQLAAAKKEQRERIKLTRDGATNGLGMSFKEVEEALERDTLINDVAMMSLKLRRILDLVPEWLDRHGDKSQAGSQSTLGDLMLSTLEEEGGLVAMAFADAQGVDIADAASDFLAQREEGNP